jgi:hypothetical protein
MPSFPILSPSSKTFAELTLVSDGVEGHGDGVEDIVDGSVATLMKG